MSARYACLHCLRRHPDPGLCPSCERAELLDLMLPDDRDLWGVRRQDRLRRRWVLAYTAVALVFTGGALAGLLRTLGPLFASKLGTSSAELVLNLAAVVLAAVFVIPLSWGASRGQIQKVPDPVDALLPATEPEQAPRRADTRQADHGAQ